jgi:hypothetical protein
MGGLHGSSRRKSKAQISFPRHHHGSLQAPRFDKASHAIITSGYIGSSPEIQPTINTHGHALGNGLVQHIFSPPSRRSALICSPSLFRRDAVLKMLCVMWSAGRQSFPESIRSHYHMISRSIRLSWRALVRDSALAQAEKSTLADSPAGFLTRPA